jgi:hypothetical protein
MMGSNLARDVDALNDELPAPEVCITQPYWSDMYEVTNAV